MDLTDVTITPMTLLGVGVVSGTIKALTGWGWVASVGAGIIPGALLGFLVGLLLFWVLSWVLSKLTRRTDKPPDGV
jgi:hypothetical protein